MTLPHHLSFPGGASATTPRRAPPDRSGGRSLIRAIGLAGAFALAFLAAGPGRLAAASDPAGAADPATPSGSIATAPAQAPRDLCILTDFFLVGGFAHGQWLTADEIKPLIRGGEVYRRFSPLAPAGEWVGDPPQAEEGPGEWTRIPARRPDGGKGEPDGSEAAPADREGLSVSCAWNPFPRPPKAQGLQGKAYLDEVRARLRANRLRAEPVVTESFRFDLEGDGTEEVLVIATNADATIPVFRKNTYTLVLFRRLVAGKVETTVLHEAYYREDQSGMADSPTGYSFGGVLDLNGDGRLELILRNGYYEGSGVEVHTLEGNRLQLVLSEGVGA